jgi:glycerol-3-phosphate dehydrogenase (NAD(P)+)
MKLTILGAGSWGLTLAWLWAKYPNVDVTIWDRKPEKLALLANNRDITTPITMTFPDTVRLSHNLGDAIDQADVIVMVVTTAGSRAVGQAMQDSGRLSPQSVIINASKGIELPSLQPISSVLRQVCPFNPIAVLSGPTLAQEILNNLPTAAAIACADAAIAEQLQAQLSCENRFRLYSNTDVIGVELGGALKNIFAIASGYMKAKGLGDNACASLITRGLAEMTRFSVLLGACEQTLFGLSGLGDLLATCNSPLSRNYQVGVQLAQNKSLDQILQEMTVVAEGVKTAFAVSQLAQKNHIEVPIINQVVRGLQGKMSADLMIKSLMGRRLKAEA